MTITELAKSWDNVGEKLFVPEHYQFSKNDDLFAFIHDNPVAQIFSAHQGELNVTASPFIVKNDTLLGGHIAGRNPHVQAIEAGAEAILLFSLKGSYISPRWFKEIMTAPTFSYISVQVRGRFVLLDKKEDIFDVLEKTVSHMENITPLREGEEAWTMEQLTSEQIDRYLGMIKAFNFEITHMEGICRLNQEKPASDMKEIIKGLSHVGTASADEIRSLMQANLNKL